MTRSAPKLSSGGIADLLGVSRQRVYQLTNSNGFPRPADEVDTGNGKSIKIWRRSDVERWAAKRDR